MDDQRLLTSAVMLETVWATRKKDLIDLITPFVFYVVAKRTSVGEKVNQNEILEIIRNDFGYPDMPVSIVEIVFKRNKDFFLREDNEFKLIKKLDLYVTEYEKRKEDCSSKINTICNQLRDYLLLHYKKKKTITEQDSANILCSFFSNLGLYFGTNRLEEQYSNYRNDETNFHVANFLLEKQEVGAKEYDYAIDLVKGFFLQSAIYFQRNKTENIDASYKEVSFYFDTPFLLKLLQFKGEADANNAKTIIDLLKNQKGKFFYFKHTQHEINRILAAYKSNIGKNSGLTLEGLDEKHYTRYDVERLENTWTNTLKSNFSISIDSSSIYQKRNPEIDFLNEKELSEELKNKIYYHDLDSVEPDLQSAIAIHNKRENDVENSIERCGCIFVTTNYKLVNVVNKFYKQRYGNDVFPLMITDSELSALTWIKNGKTDNGLPEIQLLKNAYMALEPSPELLEKLYVILDKMEKEGCISYDVASAIRSSRYVRREVLLASFDEEEKIDESFVIDVETKLKNIYSEDARLDERKKALVLQKRSYQNVEVAYDTAARKYANDKRLLTEKIARTFFSLLFGVVFLGALFGFVLTLTSVETKCVLLKIFLLFFCLVSFFSILDALKGREKPISSLICRLGNIAYDKAYKEKRNEYESIIKSSVSSTDEEVRI